MTGAENGDDGVQGHRTGRIINVLTETVWQNDGSIMAALNAREGRGASPTLSSISRTGADYGSHPNGKVRDGVQVVLS